MTDRHLVVIGGGGGASQVLLGARQAFARRSAIISVTDSGRSTGLARELFQIPAPGDLRNTLATLADVPDAPAARLVQYRLHQPQIPQLDGMALGNLMLGALCEITGDLATAAAVLADWLGVPETVVPASNDNVTLCAELADGSLRRGEVQVRGLDKPAIRRVFLEPAAQLAEAARQLIAEADLIVVGPGSFYTSVLAVLATAGIAEALRAARAPVVFLCNTTTQPGQTDGLRLSDHVRALVTQLGAGVVDAVLINDATQLTAAQRTRCAQLGLQPLELAADEPALIRSSGVEPVVAPLAEADSAERQLWNKLDTIRHDPQRLAAALVRLVS